MSTTRPFPVHELRRIVHQHDAATGMRSGFPSQADYERFCHVVELVGLCRDHLGHDRFCAVYTEARELAVRLAPQRFIIEPIRDHRHVIVGYIFGFDAAEIAEAFSAKMGSDQAVQWLQVCTVSQRSHA